MWQLHEHKQPTAALHQRADGTCICFPFDQVAYQWPGELAVFSRRRAQVNAPHVGDLPASIRPFAKRHAVVMPLGVQARKRAGDLLG